MTGNGHLLETLAHSEIYQNYERAFTEATGFPVALRSVDAWRLPLHGKAGENPFCAIMSEQSRTCAACLQMLDRLTHAAANGPATLYCAYGLSETAVPVSLGTHLVGYLQTGQVLRHPPSSANWERVERALKASGSERNLARTRAAYDATPVVSAKKLASLSGLLAIFAEHLAMKSNEITLRAASIEPPTVTRAKQFIVDHFAEDLRLSQLARELHMSVFHFCKVFKKSTGLTFTEFLSRTRVEKARNLLLNRQLRISEIAYAVGFQSLTHFNRMFKIIVGRSPTEYRTVTAP